MAAAITSRMNGMRTAPRTDPQSPRKKNTDVAITNTFGSSRMSSQRHDWAYMDPLA